MYSAPNAGLCSDLLRSRTRSAELLGPEKRWPAEGKDEATSSIRLLEAANDENLSMRLPAVATRCPGAATSRVLTGYRHGTRDRVGGHDVGCRQNANWLAAGLV
jgi:hypothetical protein